MSALLTIDHLSAATPEGSLLFSDLTLSLGRELVGVVGRNGSGKSTLLSILCDEGRAHTGTVSRFAPVSILKQIQREENVVAEALGVADDLARLRRLETGAGSIEDANGADWGLQQRIATAFAQVGATGIGLDRSVASLSGGERTRVGLAGLLIDAPGVLLMDEPTNNLDTDGRQAVADLLMEWSGGAIIASHDRDLLEHMDRIVDLSSTAAPIFVGGWSDFAIAREAQRERVEAELGRAERDLKQQALSVQRQTERKARRDKVGRAKRVKGSDSKLFLDAQAERAERTSSRESQLAGRLMEQAGKSVEEARRQVEIVTPLSIALPKTNLPANRTLVSFDQAILKRAGKRLFGPISFSITGPQRVVVSGSNGSGKTSLLNLVMGDLEPTFGKIRRADGVFAMLDQHVGFLDPTLDLVTNMLTRHPGMTRHDAHEILARFAFRNEDALRPVSTLSGGERLRAGLALVTGAPIAPQLLLLDEPTNHLDIESIEILEHALAAYDGALMLVSHDQQFLAAIGYDQEIYLENNQMDS